MNSRKRRESGLTPNMEDYLEAIAMIKRERGVSRVRDISRALHVKPSSVHSALSNLSERGFVIHERYGLVDLTPEGEKAAKDVIKRHEILLAFLSDVLGIDRNVANKDACLMEHSLSAETVRRLMKFVEFAQECSEEERSEWLGSFERYYQMEALRGKRRKARKPC